MATPAEAYRLPGISPKAYEHPADRAATAALGSIPMLDLVVRKLIEFGYERAYRQTYLGASVRIGTDQLPDIWTRYQHVLGVLDISEVYDVYIMAEPSFNAMAIGAGKPILVLNSGTVDAARRRPARGGHRPRGRPHPLRPRPVSHRAEHPPAAHRPAAADGGRPAAAGRPARPAGVVARDRADLRPRGGDRHPRPARGLQDAHDDVGRREGRRPQPRRVHAPGDGVHRDRRGPRPPAAPAHRPAPDALAAGQARARAAGLGADRRVRPHRRRRVRQARRGAPRARGGGRRRGALLRALPGPLPRDRRARQQRRQAAVGLAEEARRGVGGEERRPKSDPPKSDPPNPE